MTMRKEFLVVRLDTPNGPLIGVINNREWIFIDQDRSADDVFKAACDKGFDVHYSNEYSLPSWNFGRLLKVVANRYRKDFVLKNQFELDWDMLGRIIVRS